MLPRLSSLQPIVGPFVEADCWLAAENFNAGRLKFWFGIVCDWFSVGALNLPEWKQELGIPRT